MPDLPATPAAADVSRGDRPSAAASAAPAPARPGERARWTLRRLKRPGERQLTGLAEVLKACVDGGASVSFMQPFALSEAIGYWRGLAPAVRRGERALWVAQAGTRIIGTVQLVLAQPPNQPHRADLAKMLVHPDWRNRGVGMGLMQAAEAGAREAGKTLVVLDTASDEAQRLYRRCGWVPCGRIPGYALLPAGGLCETVLYYKSFAGPGGPG